MTKMEKENNSHNHFSTGFLLGVLVGALAVFLFGTEKGRKIVKTVTESGLDKFSSLNDVFEDDEEFEEVSGEVPKEIEKTNSQKKFFKKK